MTNVEVELAGIFEELLGVRAPGPDEDFFDLGGHSLLAVRLVAAIKKRLGVTIPLADLFEEGADVTIVRLASLVSGGGGPSPVRLRAGAGQPVFCIHPAGGEITAFRPLAGLLDCPVYGLAAPDIDGEHSARDVEGIAAYHLDRIRAIQPRGPYRLVGWSMGGAIAMEIAGRLHAAREVCDPLVLVDSYPGAVLQRLRPVDQGALPETYRAHVAALHAYEPRLPVGNLTLLFAAGGEAADQRKAAAIWGALAEGDVRQETLPGDHYSVIAEPGVAHIFTRAGMASS